MTRIEVLVDHNQTVVEAWDGDVLGYRDVVAGGRGEAEARIAAWCADQHGVLLGRRTPEALLLRLGQPEESLISVKGRGVASGSPATVDLDGEDVVGMLKVSFDSVRLAVAQARERSGAGPSGVQVHGVEDLSEGVQRILGGVSAT